MATHYLDHHLALLAHLRGILVALGEAEQVEDDSHALFLERFVAEGQAWGHVDVYAWNDADRPGKPAGGEAQGLRAAYALLKSRAA